MSVSIMKKADFSKVLKAPFEEMTKRGVGLVRDAGSWLNVVAAAGAILGTVALKADAPQVRTAAETSQQVFVAKSAPVSGQQIAFTIPVRPADAQKGIRAITFES